jgi:folate-dependent tRNA-U54 methylase TrmFO/GidA
MNINYKIIEPLEHRIPNKAERNKMISQRALNTLKDIIEREM